MRCLSLFLGMMLLFPALVSAGQVETTYTLHVSLSAETDDLDAVITVIERRLAQSGYALATVATTDKNQIDIAIEGTVNHLLTISYNLVPLVTTPGLLEFVAFDFASEDGSCVVTTAQIEFYGKPFPCEDQTVYETVLAGEIIRDATANVSSYAPDQWEITFAMTDEGSEQFGAYTESHIGELLGIVVDGTVISTPTIQSRISGEGMITGQFTQQEAQRLADVLNSGALPGLVELVEIRIVK